MTTNYDSVLETFCNYMKEYFKNDGIDRVEFTVVTANEPGEVTNPILAKLHGSVEGNIIPPTYSKGADPTIVPAWKRAREVLSQANFIRFIGYSLPATDSYVRYLLKSAAIRSEHLKGIDVLCLDPDNTVKTRYDEFIDFPKYRFRNAGVQSYLDNLLERTSNQAGSLVQHLEATHSYFFGG